MLTRKQHALLMFIHERLGQDGIAPSFDEMKDALGLKSKSGVHRLVSALEERGFLRRLPHRARALEVMRLPEDVAASPKVVRPAFGGTNEAPRRPARGAENGLELPLYGRIAAGTPIEALRDPSTHVAVPAGMIGSGEHYALEVEGDSMVEAGIHDGDTVIIRRGDQAENGEIVVALVDDAEATLKRLRRKGSAIALEPANVEYETRIYGPDRVKVQGRLVGLIRQY